MGNLIVQMISSGWIANLEEGRKLIAESTKRKEFQPK
jgi:hypothetical protein